MRLPLLLTPLLSLAFTLSASAGIQEVTDNPPADRYGDAMPEGAIVRLGSVRLLHQDLVQWVGYDATGERLLSAGGDRVLRVWDPADGASLGAIELDGLVPVSVSSRAGVGLMVLGGHDGVMELRALESGSRVARYEQEGYIPALSPDGATLAFVANVNSVQLIDRASEELLEERSLRFLVRDLIWSPDGARLAALCVNRNKLNGRAGTEEEPFAEIVAWGVGQSGANFEEARFELKEVATSRLAFSADGEVVFAGGTDGVLRALHLESRSEVAQVRVSSAPEAPSLFSLAVSPDGDWLAGGCESGVAYIWNIETGSLRHAIPVGRSAVLSLSFSPDSKDLVAAVGTNLRIFSVHSAEERVPLQRHQAPMSCVAFSPDGGLVASGGYDGQVHIWSAEDGAHRIRLGQLGVRGLDGWVFALAFGPDGDWIATGGQDGTARVWDVGTGLELLRIGGNKMAVTDVDVSPDGRLLAVASGDRVLRLWDISDLSEVSQVHAFEDLRGVVFHARFSPDGGRVGVAGTDLLIFDVQSGELLAKHENLGAMVTAFDWGPGGETLAAGLASSLVRSFGARDGETIFTLMEHRGRIKTLTFASGGGLLASASESEAGVRLWEASTGKKVGRLGEGGRSLLCTEFDPRGARLVTGGLDGLGLIWRLDR